MPDNLKPAKKGSMKTQWLEICKNLQKTLDPGTYKVWVAPLEARLEGSELLLSAPNDFVARWVRERLGGFIAAAAEQTLHRTVCVRINARSNDGPERPAPLPIRPQLRTPEDVIRPQGRSTAGSVVAPEQLGLPLCGPGGRSRNWRYAFNDFVVGPCNDMAYAAARGMTRSDAVVDTLFLSSGPGLGKTHLTQAVGRALCEASNHERPRVEYLTAEEFGSCFVQAMKARELDRFKSRFRDVDVLLLEDVHFLQNKEKMQDEVLSTIKAVQGHGGRVVLTSSFAPRELSNLDDSLVSRFCSGFLAGIEKPDLPTRRRILMEKARSQDTLLPEDVADVMAASLGGDVRQLESCLFNLILRARLLGRQISQDLAREILSQYAQDVPSLDFGSIVRKVCEGFGLQAEQLVSRSRKADFVLARNTIFYLARKHTDLSLKEIGLRFNRRHSTVIKGIAAVERELQRETPTGRQIANTLGFIEHNERSGACILQ